MILKTLKMFKYFLPYDVFERHKKVGSFIRKDYAVLDIGGELDHLSKFCSPKRLVVANLQSGDIIVKKDKLPFKKDSFDVVCAIDVIEHIPRPKRELFVKKLTNIASKKVIVSFPIGTKKHLAYEREINKSLSDKGIDIGYLNEHIKYGLPTILDIKSFTKEYKSKIFYAGNLYASKILLLIFLFDPKIKVIRKLIYYSKKIFNLFTNQLLYLILMNKSYSESVTRSYIVIIKKK